MKKLLLFLLTLTLILTLVGCKKEVQTQALTNSTMQVWDNSTKNESVEQIIFKKLNIGGILDIDNLVLDVEKKFDNGKLLLNVETRKNIAVKIDDKVKSIIDMVLDYKKLEGNLKVKHLEQAWSKVGLKINVQMNESQAKGYIELLNVKDMFKENLSKPLKIDINFENMENNEIYQNFFHQLISHPITTFIPQSDNTINVAKEIPINVDKNNICKLADGYICQNCDKKINDSEFTLNHILYDTFAETTAEGIVNKVVQIDNPTAKLNVIKKDGVEFIDGMSVKTNLNINISKSQLDIIAKDLTSVYNNEELYNIYKSIISILNYDTALISSEIEFVTTNRVLK